MSTSTENHPVVVGFRLLQEGLHPAKLEDTKENGKILLDWVTARGYDLQTMNAQQIAAILRVAVENIIFENTLTWSVQPIKLRRQLEIKRTEEIEAAELKRRQAERAENSEKAFFERVKQGEKEGKATKDNDKAKAEAIARNIQSVILAIEENGNRPGVIDHQKSELARQYLFNFVNHRRSQRVPDATILKELREVTSPAVEDIKRELERRWELTAVEAPKPRRDSLGFL